MSRAKLLVLVSPLLVVVICHTSAFGQTPFWQQTNGPLAGSGASSFSILPNGHLFALTNGDGIFRSTDDGSRWIYVSNIASSFLNSLTSDSTGTLFASGYQNGLFRSSDEAETWDTLTAFLPSKKVSNVAVDAADHILIATDDSGLFRSTNRGESWIRINLGIKRAVITAIYRRPTLTGNELLVGTDSGMVFRSTDPPTSWTAIRSVTTPTLDDLITAITTTSDGSIYLGTYAKGVYRSTDEGTQWTNQNGNLADPYVSTLASDTADHLYLSTLDWGKYRSTDFGDHWTRLAIDSVTWYFNSFLNDHNGNLFIGGYGVWRSTDLGESWNKVGLPSSIINCLVRTQSGAIVAGTSNYYTSLYTTTNGGDEWLGGNTPFLRSVNAYAETEGGVRKFIATDQGFYQSLDGGRVWSPAIPGYQSGYGWTIAVNMQGSIFVGGGLGNYRSNDGGLTWMEINHGFSGATSTDLLAARSGDLFAASFRGVYRSQDQGNNWESFNTGLSDTAISNLAEDSSGNIYAGTAFHRLFQSTNAGAEWHELQRPPGDASYPIFALATYSSNVIYVGGFGLVVRSSDYGVTWSTLSDGIRGRFVNKITFDDEGYCYVGIMRGGVYRSVQPVSAVEGEPTSLPSEYSLGDAYPNPFNPAMLISFGIAKRSHVKLQVFNLLGQLITTLVNESKSPGTYTVTWDASTRPSGLYFYRMTAGGFVQTKKAILIR